MSAMNTFAEKDILWLSLTVPHFHRDQMAHGPGDGRIRSAKKIIAMENKALENLNSFCSFT